MKEAKIELLSRQYCVAVAGFATTALAAGATLYQQQQAKKAQEQAAQRQQDLYQNMGQGPQYASNLGTSDSPSLMLSRDVANQSQTSMPLIMSIANRVQRRNERQRNRMTGGAFGQTMLQEGMNIMGMQRGEVPQDVQDSIQRIVAENLGGAMGPALGGGFGSSMTANTMARNLGKTSYEIAQEGMRLGQSYRSNVDSFLYKPQEAMAQFYLPQAQMAQQMAEAEAGNQYTAQANEDARNLAAQQASIQAQQNNAMWQGAMNQQMIQSGMQLANAGIGLYGAARPAQTANPTTGLLKSGYYNSLAAAQQAYGPNAQVQGYGNKGYSLYGYT